MKKLILFLLLTSCITINYCPCDEPEQKEQYPYGSTYINDTNYIHLWMQPPWCNPIQIEDTAYYHLWFTPNKIQ